MVAAKRCEHRKDIRVLARGIIVIIDGHVHPVINISAGGMCIQATCFSAGEKASAKVAKMRDISKAVNADFVVRQIDETKARVQFIDPKLPLLRLIVSHVGSVIGVEPREIENV